MCGIGGILRVHPAGAEVPPPEAAIPEAWLDILDESIKHRGPDGAGRFRDRAARPDGSVVDVALVHRRLSILDHAGGGQPMVSPHGRPGRDEGLVAVVFNGCIYNHRELREQLRAAGHEFVSDHSDTEVLVHGWREWGDGLQRRLEGMFAYAIWRRPTPDTGVFDLDFVYGRDPAGEKPLYRLGGWRGLADGSRVTAFSSTAAGLLRLAPHCGPYGDTELRPSRRLLHHWLRYGYGGTLVPAVQQVEAPYLDDPTVKDLYHAELADGLPLRIEDAEALVRSAVHRRLEADVPLGVFLSGGVDSSLVACFAREQLGALRTISVRMPEPRYDESAYAERVARCLGTRHETIEVSLEPADDLTRLIEQFGLPLGDSSLLPTYWVSRAAAETLRVALGGDGADELFFGYERYLAVDVLGRRRRMLAAIPGLLLPRRNPKSIGSKLARLADVARSGDFFDLGAIFPKQEIEELAGERRRRPWIWPITGAALRRADLTNYLPDDLLRKVDVASMAVGLEVRSPFLDRSVIHAATRASPSSLMLGGKRKGLLRAIARKHLPADIVDRPKMGFAIPISEWFRADYGGMKTLLMDRLRSTEPFGPPSLGIELDMQFIERMIGEHMEERRDHGQRLYMLLVLSIWAAWVGRQRARD